MVMFLQKKLLVLVHNFMQIRTKDNMQWLFLFKYFPFIISFFIDRLMSINATDQTAIILHVHDFQKIKK